MLRLDMAFVLKRAKKLGDESIAEIAARSGVSKPTLHRLEAGGAEPSLGSLRALQSAYGGRLESYIDDRGHTAQAPAAVPSQRRGGTRRRSQSAAR
ncbi:helix-turn-helix domain-containing protein [Streptomyces fagopyri]|uniref:helix-turn-helix domain-containing protein n=1 Tax=Streptomyces fagopyri TaxID=2662397 RepID=UPI0037F2BE67